MADEREDVGSGQPQSVPGKRYSADQDQLQRFAIFVTNAAVVLDARISLSHTIRIVSTKQAAEQRAGAIGEFATHLQLFLQMMICRAVDNYLTYTSELLALVFHTRPETLRSNETARLDLILQFKTMDDLIGALVERRVTSLAYQGMRDLSLDLSRKLGFDLFERPDDLERAVQIIEVRNLIVHNRATVNSLFRSRLPDYAAQFGERLELDGRSVLNDIEFLGSSVSDIDSRAIQKFGLPVS